VLGAFPIPTAGGVVPLPPFSESGELPLGLHPATLREVLSGSPIESLHSSSAAVTLPGEVQHERTSVNRSATR